MVVAGGGPNVAASGSGDGDSGSHGCGREGGGGGEPPLVGDTPGAFCFVATIAAARDASPVGCPFSSYPHWLDVRPALAANFSTLTAACWPSLTGQRSSCRRSLVAFPL